MRKFLTATLLCMALTVTMVPAAFAADTADSNYTTCMAAIQEQKVIQDQAHQTAESLRQKGYDDSSAYIQAAQSTWWAAQDEIVAYQKLSQYTDEDIRILTTAVFYEAGHTTEQLREYVAQVVLNRVADSRFPDTVKGVITQPGQYATKYATQAATDSIKSADSQNGTYYYAMCETAVKKAMMGQVDMPSNVLYQANFAQGKGVWQSVYFNSGWYAKHQLLLLRLTKPSENRLAVLQKGRPTETKAPLPGGCTTGEGGFPYAWPRRPGGSVGGTDLTSGAESPGGARRGPG